MLIVAKNKHKNVDFSHVEFCKNNMDSQKHMSFHVYFSTCHAEQINMRMLIFAKFNMRMLSFRQNQHAHVDFSGGREGAFQADFGFQSVVAMPWATTDPPWLQYVY